MWLFVLISLYSMYLLYYKVIKKGSYWFKRGVPTINPIYWFKLYGENIIRTNDTSAILKRIYEKHKCKPYVGLYQLMEPILMVLDPELIKQILVKDFYSFSEHDGILKEDVLWSTNVFALSIKDGWQDLRSILSAFFTSSKLRSMFPLMQECSGQFLHYLKNNEGNSEIEMINSFARYANDVIARTAFSVTCDSLNDKDEFYQMVREANHLSAFSGLKYILFLFSPWLMKLLNVKTYNEKTRNFFSGFIKESIKLRSEHTGARPDLIQILVDSRKTSSEYSDGLADKSAIKHSLKLTDENIVAQSLVFFYAGVETISTALTYICYELAKNPDVQDKLCAEIHETLLNCNGKITYDSLVSMKYLDGVISEVLRLHPQNYVIERRCVKACTINDEKRLHLEKNSWVWIPFGAIQRDEQFFPNADQLVPERFVDQKEHPIKPFTYFPFGAGPRNCIGLRFGILECKLLIVELLQHYELVPIAKTEMHTNNQVRPMKMWIGFKPKK